MKLKEKTIYIIDTKDNVFCKIRVGNRKCTTRMPKNSGIEKIEDRIDRAIHMANNTINLIEKMGLENISIEEYEKIISKPTDIPNPKKILYPIIRTKK